MGTPLTKIATRAPLSRMWHNHPPVVQCEQPRERKFSNEEVLAKFMLGIDAKFKAINDTIEDFQASI